MGALQNTVNTAIGVVSGAIGMTQKSVQEQMREKAKQHLQDKVKSMSKQSDDFSSQWTKSYASEFKSSGMLKDFEAKAIYDDTKKEPKERKDTQKISDLVDERIRLRALNDQGEILDNPFRRSYPLYGVSPFWD